MRITRISSLQNPRLKSAALLRSHRPRQKRKQFLIDGPRECGRAVEAGIRLRECFFLAGSPSAESVTRLREHPSLAETQWFEVTADAWEKLSYGERRDGLVAVADAPQCTLERLSLGTNPLVVVLDRVEKPGNIGAVVRTAHSVGADAVIVVEGTTDLFNPNIIRASVGSVFATPLLAASRDQAFEWIQTHALRLVLTRVDAPRSLYDVDFNPPTAILLGNEARGIDGAWSSLPHEVIRIPMRGSVGSLNTSVAAAVVLYEAFRQRDRPPEESHRFSTGGSLPST